MFFLPKVIFIQQHSILNKQCQEPWRAQSQFPAWGELEGTLCLSGERNDISLPPLTCSYHAEFSLHSESFSLFFFDSLMSLRMQWSLQINVFFLHFKHALNTSTEVRAVLNAGKIGKQEETAIAEEVLRARLVKWCLMSLLHKCCQ